MFFLHLFFTVIILQGTLCYADYGDNDLVPGTNGQKIHVTGNLQSNVLSDIEEAKIIYSRTPRAYAAPGRLCNKPHETPLYTCLPDGGSYPASKATCECVNCSKNFSLICASTGFWASRTNTGQFCSLGAKISCGSCPAKFPLFVSCPKSNSGLVGEERSCSCKKTCADVTLTCGRDSQWSPRNSHCEEGKVPTVYDEKAHMHVMFQNGKYYYICEDGYEIERGRSIGECLNGIIRDLRPDCKPIQMENKPISEKPDESDSEYNKSSVQQLTTEKYSQITATTVHNTLNVLQVLRTDKPTVTKVPIMKIPAKPAAVRTTPMSVQNDSVTKKPEHKDAANDEAYTVEVTQYTDADHTDHILEPRILPVTEAILQSRILIPGLDSGPYNPQYPLNNGPPKQGNRKSKPMKEFYEHSKHWPIKQPAKKPFPLGIVIASATCVVILAFVIISVLVLSRRYKVVCELGTKRFPGLIGFSKTGPDENEESELRPITSVKA